MKENQTQRFFKEAQPGSLRKALESYLEHRKNTNYSLYSLRSHTFFLRAFILWCEDRSVFTPQEVTPLLLHGYGHHIARYRKEDGQPLANSSQLSYLKPVRVFFKQLKKGGVLLYNPAADLDMPLREKRLPRGILSAEEAERLLDQPDTAKWNGIRDRAILETFYSTGIRRMELARLCTRDLDAAARTLMIRLGKGKKDRLVPIGERAVRWIEKYLGEVRNQLLRDAEEPTLFLTRFGTGFSVNQLSAKIKEYLRMAGIEKPGSCHILRHTMATLMLENGADIRYIQAILGHAKIGTTEIYTHVNIAKLKEVHALSHPAGKPFSL